MLTLNYQHCMCLLHACDWRILKETREQIEAKASEILQEAVINKREAVINILFLKSYFYIFNPFVLAYVQSSI